MPSDSRRLPSANGRAPTVQQSETVGQPDSCRSAFSYGSSKCAGPVCGAGACGQGRGTRKGQVDPRRGQCSLGCPPLRIRSGHPERRHRTSAAEPNRARGCWTYRGLKDGNSKCEKPKTRVRRNRRKRPARQPLGAGKCVRKTLRRQLPRQRSTLNCPSW